MPLTADAVAALAAKGLTLATAEATTAGLIGHLLTDIPGSPRVFRGGVARYANLSQAGDRRAGLAVPNTAQLTGKPPKPRPMPFASGRARTQDSPRLAIASPGGTGPDRPAASSGSRWPL